MMDWYVRALLLLGIFFAGCFGHNGQAPVHPNPPSPIDPTMVVQFKGRQIDLQPHLEGFKYIIIAVDVRGGCMVYKLKGDEEQLMLLRFDPADKKRVDFAKGNIISARDFSKRNLWNAFCNPVNGRVVFWGDEDGGERANLYEINLETKEERALTNVAYVYGYVVSPDGHYVVYSTRSTEDEASSGDLRILDLRDGTERVVYNDAPDLKMTWGQIIWRPDGQGILAPVLAAEPSLAGDRTRANLIYVSLKEGEVARVLTDVTKERTDLYPLGWDDDGKGFFLISDEEGYSGAYHYSFATGKGTLISQPGDNIKAAATAKDGHNVYAVVVSGNPLKSNLKYLDQSGRVLFERAFEGSLSIEDAYGDHLMAKTSSNTEPFALLQVNISQGRVTTFERGGYPADLLDQVVHCTAEKVSFPTFDKPVVPGEANGQLHAYLYSPKLPRQGADRRALVTAFYGGTNQFNSTFQIICQAGYYVLSPAFRGSENFGTEFYSLGDGDIGGAETLDALWGGKWLANRLGLAQKQVGIFGGSRGGYDTLRALTFPDEVNGFKEQFRFGFGWSDFGMSNLIRAYRDGNIQGWYVKLTGGDPTTNPEKWNDRSPDHHLDLLNVPLLLTHGSKDPRVPPVESRAFYEQARAMGKNNVTYFEVEGQGHGYKGTPARLAYWKAVFAFLESF